MTGKTREYGLQMEKSAFLTTALEAAEAASEVIRHYYASGVKVDIKPDLTPVTRADVESEEVIRQCIARRFPAHGFYGEETGRSNAGAEYLWLVDPIDGTRSFVRGYPFFSTQIALMHRGELILGVSSAPAFSELMWAERGTGAWFGEDRAGVSGIDTIAEASLSSGNLKTLASGGHWGRYGRIVAQVSRIRGYGDFYHYHLLARGCIDAVIESDINVLDIAALAVIVEEAGGRFTALDGSPVGLHTTTALATNSRLHVPLLEAMTGPEC